MRVLVLGAAVSGAAAARLARRLGHAVTVYDRSPGAGAELAAEGIAVTTGEWDRQVLEGMDLVVTSPGIPERSLPIVEALEAGLEVWSEVELAWRHLGGVPVAAVTGTNGKTTVTELIAAMCSRSGLRTAPVGNIGSPLSAAVGEDWDLLVVEVSSFQLRFTEEFHPRWAVLLNLAADHLDWHGSQAAYMEAKQRVFRRQGPDDLLVYDCDDPGAVAATTPARSRRVPVSGRRLPPEGYGVEGDRLVLPGTRLPLDQLEVQDPVYLVDLAAAAVVAEAAGANPDAVAAVARGFRPGPHRRRVVGEIDGVVFVDDSKATNPHAALAAAAAYPSVVLIAGGLAKGLDVTPLATAPTVRHLVAIGEAAPELLRAAGPGRGTAAASMGEAVAVAWRVAQPGDVVLLAPGCASFDMFSSYAARGDAFAAAVSAIMEEGGARR